MPDDFDTASDLLEDGSVRFRWFCGACGTLLVETTIKYSTTLEQLERLVVRDHKICVQHQCGAREGAR